MHEGHRERMWDRLYFHGDSMSDHELLETLLFFVIPRRNTNPIAHELLDRFGSLEALFSAGPAAIEQVAGIGRKSAEFVHLVGLMIGRIKSAKSKRKKLTNFAEIADFARSRFQGKNTELFEVYCLSAGGELLCAKSFAAGTSAKVSVDSKSLSGLLVTVQPASILVAHNHPSGRCAPSADDDEAAEKINQVCRINGVALSDCIICSEEGEPFSYFHSHRFEQLGISRETGKPRKPPQ